MAQAKAFEADNMGSLTEAIAEVYTRHGGMAQWPCVRDKFDIGDTNTKYRLVPGLLAMVTRLDDPTAFTEVLDRTRAFTVQFKSFGVDKAFIPLLQAMKEKKTGTDAVQAKQAVDKAVQEIEQAD